MLVLHRLEISWRLSFIDSFISCTLIALVSYSSVGFFRFYQPVKSSRVYRLIYTITGAVIYCVALSFALNWILPKEIAYLEFLERSMPLRFISGLMVISFISLLNWMYNLLNDQKEQEQRKTEAEQLVKDAELVKLRQQLQPHFLFNSLNSISALAGSKPDEARKMIQQLSDFLRGTLKKDEQKVVSLKEEMQHLNLYLEIEKVRFGHRLSVEQQVADEVLGDMIPPLLLQPIVENAIKFGLYGTIEDITVTVSGRSEQGYLFVEVKNPFDAETQTAARGTGFGLSSIQRRLFLLYGRNDLLSTEKKESIFITRLKIPQLQLN
ncbi:sensor histidine kinase [Sphingobacteriaceae bacterium]|nr:sensor histidine kinase [Sphingobacteriaceae bacterium]